MTAVAWILVVLMGITVAVIAAVFLVVPFFRGLAWVLTGFGRGVAWTVTHIFSFIFGMLSDIIRAVGGVITALVFVPLVVGNIAIGRWSAAGHFGRALQDEFVGVGHCLYRVFVGHPGRLLLLHGALEGIEKRIPQAVAAAPGADRPSGRSGQFEGYKVVGSLQGGGSGGRLYVAEPDERKSAAFAREGRTVRQVVIKSFSLDDGSSLPQIIRESRALEAARKLGLVLDHELTDARFYYVMEFIPGDSLTTVTKRLHAESGAEGLGVKQLIPALTMMADLLGELERYHRGGLWHKDVKPDNIIINQGRAFLVDLGLITPLRSAMTLTTHGTEYFRDPEMVRMALRGAKVNEVDGVKFDIYGAGAVLFSVLENSFPAHGGLSQLGKSCPEAVRWIIRRAMTDLQKRYSSAAEMQLDLRTVIGAADPFGLKPVDLPSVNGQADSAELAPAVEERFAPSSPRPASPAGAGVPPGDGQRGQREQRGRPRIELADWWTGKHRVVSEPGGGGAQKPGGEPFDPEKFGQEVGRQAQRAAAVGAAAANEAARAMHGIFGGRMGGAGRSPAPPGPGKTAAEQLASAQERVRRAQERVASRMSRGALNTSFRKGRFETKPNPGVAAAFFVFLGAAVGGAFLTIWVAERQRESSSAPMAASGGEGLQIITDQGRHVFRVDPQAGDWSSFSALDYDISKESEREAHNAGPRESQDDLAALNRGADKVIRTAKKLIGLKSSGAVSEDSVGTTVPAAPAAPAAPMPVIAGSGMPVNVLMLDMLPADIGEALESQTRALRTRLQMWGYLIRGEGDGTSETELLASAKRVIELDPPSDDEAAARLSAWVEEVRNEVGAVIWLGPGLDEKSVDVRVVSSSTIDRARLNKALSERNVE